MALAGSSLTDASYSVPSPGESSDSSKLVLDEGGRQRRSERPVYVSPLLLILQGVISWDMGLRDTACHRETAYPFPQRKHSPRCTARAIAATACTAQMRPAWGGTTCVSRLIYSHFYAKIQNVGDIQEIPTRPSLEKGAAMQHLCNTLVREVGSGGSKLKARETLGSSLLSARVLLVTMGKILCSSMLLFFPLPVCPSYLH